MVCFAPLVLTSFAFLGKPVAFKEFVYEKETGRCLIAVTNCHATLDEMVSKNARKPLDGTDFEVMYGNLRDECWFLISGPKADKQ